MISSLPTVRVDDMFSRKSYGSAYHLESRLTIGCMDASNIHRKKEVARGRTPLLCTERIPPCKGSYLCLYLPVILCTVGSDW